MIGTTIRKKVFKRKMEELKRDGFFIEYKEPKRFWKIRVQNQKYPTTINFLVGQISYKFKAIEYKLINYYGMPGWVQEFFKDSIYKQMEYFIAIKCIPIPILEDTL